MYVRRLFTVLLLALGLGLTATPAIEGNSFTPAGPLRASKEVSAERDTRTATGAVQVMSVSREAILKVKAKKTPKRHKAIRWAKKQKGKPYCWGGNGPRCFDCSGLIKKAYGKAGITLPRVAHDIWTSKKTKTIAKSKARWGDLVFWFNSSGRVTHAEFLAGPKLKHSFGAHKSGTKIGWRKLYGKPRYAHVVGAG